jgi:hypothetical protein
MHQASICMTACVMLMGGAWYGLETGMIGPQTPDEASVAIEAGADAVAASPEAARTAGFIARSALNQRD